MSVPPGPLTVSVATCPEPAQASSCPVGATVRVIPAITNFAVVPPVEVHWNRRGLWLGWAHRTPPGAMPNQKRTTSGAAVGGGGGGGRVVVGAGGGDAVVSGAAWHGRVDDWLGGRRRGGGWRLAGGTSGRRVVGGAVAGGIVVAGGAMTASTTVVGGAGDSTASDGVVVPDRWSRGVVRLVNPPASSASPARAAVDDTGARGSADVGATSASDERSRLANTVTPTTPAISSVDAAINITVEARRRRSRSASTVVAPGTAAVVSAATSGDSESDAGGLPDVGCIERSVAPIDPVELPTTASHRRARRASVRPSDTRDFSSTGRDEDRCGAEELFRCEQSGATVGAQIALLAVSLDEIERRTVERGAGADDRRQVRTGRVAPPPEHHRTDRVGQPGPHAEQELVRIVGGDTEFLGDLGRRQPVPEVQVEDARPLAEDDGRGLYQPVAIVRGADLGHVELAPRPDEVGRASVVHPGHDLGVQGRAATVSFEAIEGPVAGDAQQPATERLDPVGVPIRSHATRNVSWATSAAVSGMRTMFRATS